MPRPDITPIEKTERERPGGLEAVTTEQHPSFVLVGISHVSGKTRLFESEMEHSHFIRLTIQTCERERDLHRSWLHGRQTIVEVDMSLAQWGAIVSSPNQGSGKPATLTRFHHPEGLPEGMTPEAEWEPQLAHTHREVRDAGTRALSKITEAFERYQEAIDQKLGAKEVKSRRHHLQCMIANGPGNMEFAAKSLTEHVEEVVTKARGDIESMVQQAVIAGESLELEAGHTIAGRLLGAAPSDEEHVVEDAEVVEDD